MLETQTICPYTGLRSFSEEESLYFKGRDTQVDQITALLEQNKFLMVTGASGEGKSSLIYGGLIPNAKAGFFKAHYTNWVVADFRPERNPVRNMANALAASFHQQPASIETELRRGFSSLVDLYTNSEYYIDEEERKLLSEAALKEKKRSAANLLIIIDQFEEFFTNPENFNREAPSQDSQIVVNLALETARLALKRNLPIYLICTMRSDFIGQCAAFRGLPEYIGFSQFFVPRLKRKDLKQVIEEPAILSGNRISQRLIERLVFDLAEGIDQLPILQHALSQIWLAADHGREEMDLLHYAMVGGMPAHELPDEHQGRFSAWFQSLPEQKRDYFHVSGLNKVIEIHANSLYEGAWEYYMAAHPDKPITKQVAKRIIALTFACLTKIDNSRAVRNRMTVQEITDIINTPGLTTDIVGEVLSIYREEGNAFIRPFKTEDPSTQVLRPDSVLDITHESLIRNWNKLDEWAKTEYEYYTTYLDFRAQLDRWKKSGKNSGYLLPIGPLSYFENWYNQCRPNVGWISRYGDASHSEVARREAEETLADIQDFLKRSARKAIIARTFMKYGTQRIAAVLAMVIMIGLSGFYWYDAEQKRNERVIERVRAEAMALLPSPEIDNFTKGTYLITEERYNPGTLLPYLSGLDMRNKIGLSVELYRQLIEFDLHFSLPIKDELITFIAQSFPEIHSGEDAEFLLAQRNKFMVLLALDEYYNPGEARKEALKSVANANYRLTLSFLTHPEYYRPSIPTDLNIAIQYWLTFAKPGADDLQALMNAFSPFAGEKAVASFHTYFPKGSFEPNGRESTDFNGGYHALASLYAAAGGVNAVIQCIDAIVTNGQKSYLELPNVFNNHIGIIGYLYQYGHRDMAPTLIRWIGSNSQGNPPITLYRNAVLRAGYINHLYQINISKQTQSHRGNLYPNLALSDRSVFLELMEDYEAAIREIKDPAERNFQLAMNHKRKAMLLHKYAFDRGLPADQAALDALFEKAIAHYRLLETPYLEGTENITIPYFTDGIRPGTFTRRQLFIYPDYMGGWFCRPYHSDAFFAYMKRHNLLPELYQTEDNLQMLHLWIARAHEVHPFLNSGSYRNDYPLPDQTLEDLLAFVKDHPEGKGFDRNLPTLILVNRFLEADDTLRGRKYLQEMDPSSVQRSRDRYEYIEKTFFINQMKTLGVNLAQAGWHQEAIAFTELTRENFRRIYIYLAMAEATYRKDTSDYSMVYLDSTYSLYKQIDFSTTSLDVRFNLVSTLASIGGEQLNARALEVLRDFNANARTGGTFQMIYGISSEGNFYRALTSIPASFTESQELDARGLILWQACKRKESAASSQDWKAMDTYFMWFDNYIFFQPN